MEIDYMNFKLKSFSKEELERKIHEAQCYGYSIVGEIHINSFGEFVQEITSRS